MFTALTKRRALKVEYGREAPKESKIQCGSSISSVESCGQQRHGCLARALTIFWSCETSFFLSLWVWFLIGGRSRFFRDPGVLWHTKVGQQILTTGSLPRNDLFSFTFADKPWIAQEWLGEYALALLHLLAGFDGILLGTATLLAGFYTWLAHRLIRMGVQWFMAVFIVLLALNASSYHFHPRPHLITLVFLGWTLARLCDFEAGRIRLRGLFWLVPVSLIWTNIHGGVVGGPATFALAIAGWGLWKAMGHDSPLLRYRDFIPLGGVLLCCALTTIVNPYGMELLRVWFALIRSPILPQLMEEHQPLTRSAVGWTVLLFGIIYLLALVSVLPKPLRITWLIPIVWFYLAWTRIRHGPLFAATATLALAEMFPHIRWLSWLSRCDPDLFRVLPCRITEGRKRLDPRPALVPTALVLTACICQASGFPLPILGRGWAGPDAARWPLQLLPELRAYERSHPPGTPIFNEMLFGGFLIYYTPGLRVFIDDRCELYGDEQLLAYARAHYDPEQISWWARQYGFDRALVSTGSILDQYLRRTTDWRVIRETPVATFHGRYSPEARERLDPPVHSLLSQRMSDIHAQE